MLSRSARVDAVVMRPRSGVRPTTRKVFEALFAILDPLVEPWERLHVLDAFAGTGQLGWAALERGAAELTFIEQDSAVAGDLRRRANRDPRVHIIRGDACEVLGRLRHGFDLVFIDPPYSQGLASRALEMLGARGLVSPEGWAVAEHHHKEALPDVCRDLPLVRRQRYGETCLSLYQRPRLTASVTVGSGSEGGERNHA